MSENATLEEMLRATDTETADVPMSDYLGISMNMRKVTDARLVNIIHIAIAEAAYRLVGESASDEVGEHAISEVVTMIAESIKLKVVTET